MRCGLLKQHRQLSYEELAFHLDDSASFRAFTRLALSWSALHPGVGLERLSRLMGDLFGLDISEGALVNILWAARQRFAATNAAIRARLLSGTVICSDETGVRVGKRSWWLWIFYHGQNPVS